MVMQHDMRGFSGCTRTMNSSRGPWKLQRRRCSDVSGWFCSLSKRNRWQNPRASRAECSQLFSYSMFHSFPTAWQDNLFTMKAAQNETDSDVTQKGSKGCPQECKDRAGCYCYSCSNSMERTLFLHWSHWARDQVYLLSCSLSGYPPSIKLLQLPSLNNYPTRAQQETREYLLSVATSEVCIIAAEAFEGAEAPFFTQFMFTHKPPIYCIFILCVFIHLISIYFKDELIFTWFYSGMVRGMLSWNLRCELDGRFDSREINVKL